MTGNGQTRLKPEAHEDQDRTEERRLQTNARKGIRSPFFPLQPSQLPSDPDDSAFCRRHPRSPVQIRVEISLVHPDGSSYDWGTGVVRDLSRSRLLLTDVALGKGSFLASSFGIRLHPEGETLGGSGIAGRIRRSSASGLSDFGFEFQTPESGVEEILRHGR